MRKKDYLCEKPISYPSVRGAHMRQFIQTQKMRVRDAVSDDMNIFCAVILAILAAFMLLR